MPFYYNLFLGLFAGGGLPAFKFTVNTANAGSASDKFILPVVNVGGVWEGSVKYGDGNEATFSDFATAQTALNLHISIRFRRLSIGNHRKFAKFQICKWW